MRSILARNEHSKEFATLLQESSRRARVPIVPGINDTEEEMKEIRKFLVEITTQKKLSYCHTIV